MPYNPLSDTASVDMSGSTGFNPLEDAPKRKERPIDTPKVEERSYAGRVVKEALPAMANTAEDIAFSIPSGIRGLGQAIATGSMEQGVEGYQSNMQALQDNLPRFRGQNVEATQQTIGEGFDTIVQAGGTAVNKAVELQRQLEGTQLAPGAQMKSEAALRSIGEAGVQLAPVPGLEGAAGVLSRIPKVGSVARGMARGAREYDAWGAGMENRPPDPTQMRGPDQGGANQPYLFSDEQGIPQDVRSPYNLPKSEVERITEEIRQSTADPNQADMLSGFNPVDKFRLDEGGIGARDKEAGPDLEARGVRGTEGQFQPSLTDTEYTGPRQVGDTDNRIAYTKYHPDDINPLLEAESKPGFLQSAVDKINLRFEQIRQAEAKTQHGLDKLTAEVRESPRNRGLSPMFTSEDITGAVEPLPIPAKVQRLAETTIMKDQHAPFTQYLPVETIWQMRDHNRLTDPKSESQFTAKEASVLKNGINKPLEIKYSKADGKAVLTNGNTRASLAMKHGLDEVPVRVTVTDKPLSGTEATNAVDVGQHDVKVGDAKPSDIGLTGRDPKPVAASKPKSPPKQLGDTGQGKKQRGGPGFNIRTPKDITAAIRQLSAADDRPLSEVTQGMTAQTIKDFDGPTHGNLMRDLLANAKQFGRQLLDARSLRKLAEDTSAGPIVSWVNKNIETTDRWFRNSLAEFIEGKNFKSSRIPDRLLGRQFVTRSTEGGLHDIHDRIAKMGPTESKKFWELVDKHNGVDGEVPFTSDKQRELFEARQSVFAKLHNLANEARDKVGIDKAAWLPNFSPRVRAPGDYILNAYDPKTGDLVWSRPFKSPGIARRALEQLKSNEATKDLKFGDPQHKKMVGINNTDLQAFIETRRAVMAYPELSQAIDKAIQDVVGRRGAGGHLMERTREKIGGYLGEDYNLKDLRQADLNYTEHMLNYTANLKRREIHMQLENLRLSSAEEPKTAYRYSEKTGGMYPDKANKLEDIAPNLHSYLTEYIMQSRGALQALDQLDKAFMQEFGKGLQIGATGLQRGIFKLNTFATVGFLLKNPFWLSQAFQPTAMIARILKTRQELGSTYLPGVSEAHAGFHFLRGYMNTILPRMDAHATDFVNHMVKEGFIDPMSQHMFEATDNYNIISTTFFKFTGHLERDATRIPAGLVIESALRDLIPDRQKRFEVATAQMFHSMAGQTKSNMPLIYQKMGPVGMMAKNLKSYGTNAYGQFAEYLRYAVNGMSKGELQQIAPLVSYLGAMGLVGGISGVILMQEADALITLINAGTNSNIRTPQEWIMTGGISDLLTDVGMPKLAQDVDGFFKNGPVGRAAFNTLTFGGASALTGRNIQPQVSNPPATSLIDIVPLKLIWTPTGGGLLGESLRDYVVAAAKGQLTDAMRMKAYQAITLNNPHAKTLIEAYFQKPGNPVPQPSQNMSGNYYRSTEDYVRTGIAGAKTLTEAQSDILFSYFKRHEARLERDRSLDKNSFVDDMMNGEPTPDKLEKYFEKGGNPQSLKQDMQDLMLQRGMTGMEYQQVRGGKSGGNSYGRKLIEMDKYTNTPNPSGPYNPLAPEPQRGQGNALIAPRPMEPRAEGGPVEAGQPYLVGERGPEALVTPSGRQMVGTQGPQVIRPPQSGTVLPNNTLNRAVNPAPVQGPPVQWPLNGGARTIRGQAFMDSGDQKPSGAVSRMELGNEMDYAMMLEQQSSDNKVRLMQQQHPEQAKDLAEIYRWIQRQQLDKMLSSTIQNNQNNRRKPYNM